MAVAGLRGTGDWGTDERPKEFREMILWLDPNGQTPLTGLMSKVRSEKLTDPQFSWWEETNTILRYQVNYSTGYVSTANTIVVDTDITGITAQDLVIGDVLLVEAATELAGYADEIAVVSSITDANTIVIKRGEAGSTNAALVDDQSFTKIGNVFEEGTTSPEVTSRNPTKLTNYAQIFRTAWEITNTAALTKARTGALEANEKRRSMFRHAAAMENAFLFGKQNETTGSAGKPMRFMGGLREFITSNTKVYTTSPTENDFIDQVANVFDYTGGGAGNQRIVFCGNGFLTELNKLIKDSTSTRINFQSTIKLWGMDLHQVIIPQGTLFFKTHPLMNIHARYTNSAFIIDPSAITYRYLRDTRTNKNIQANDADTMKNELLSEVSLEVHHERTMGYLGNFVV